MHKIEPGGTDKSYGLHVAKLAGIPNSVIARANEVLDNLEKLNLKFQGQLGPAKKGMPRKRAFKPKIGQMTLFTPSSAQNKGDEKEKVD